MGDGAGWGGGIVRVLDAEPELLRGVGEEEGARLRRQVTTDLVDLGAGMPLHPEDIPGGAFALLVLRGTLIRHVRLAGRGSSELLGAGDVLRPWQDDGSLASIGLELTQKAVRGDPLP